MDKISKDRGHMTRVKLVDAGDKDRGLIRNRGVEEEDITQVNGGRLIVPLTP
jgi:hypothetical protein